MFFEGKEVKDFFRWAFYVFIAIFPFVLYEGYLFNGTSARAVNTVLFVEILALVLGFALLYKKNKLSFAKSPITISLALLLVGLFVSSFLGVDMNASFWSKATRTTGLFYFLHMTVMYMLFWISFDKEEALKKFLKVFVVSAGIFSVLSVFGQEGFGWLFASKPWDGLTIGNSTFAGMYLYAGFMMAVYLVFTQSESKWWKKMLPFIFVFNPYLINFDIFRGGANIFQQPASIIGSAQASSATLLLSVLGLLAFYLIWKIKKANTRRAILFAVVGIGIISFALGAQSLLSRGGKVQELYLIQSTATRPIVWEASKEAIAERPIFGWGVDNFDRTFQKYYNNTILEKKNGGEAWLDRAHNIFIDQTIESGYVGIILYMLVYGVLLGSLIYVILRSKERDDVVLATVLAVYFAGHLLELQTAFDTTITYVPLVAFSAISGILFYRTRGSVSPKEDAVQLPEGVQKTAGIILIGLAGVLFFAGAVPIMRAQSANGDVRRVGSSEKRLPVYEKLFSSPLDKGSFLWRTSNDVQRGVSLSPDVLEKPQQRDGLIKELDVIVLEYEKYLENHPDDFRAILNLADIYIYQRLFDIDNLNKAHAVLDHAIEIVPQSPQSHWMKAVAYLYQAKFNEAKASAKQAYDINPDIEESARVVEYINQAIKEFPEIDLYSFKQI